jgi:hypothetical protein
MKAIGTILLITGIIIICGCIVNNISGRYSYERNFNSFWNLADKSSTLEAKREYIGKFITALSKGNFEGKYNAVFLTTPDNSFDMNFKALNTLYQRLDEIKTMNPSSFEYQTAIQQITAQEQGEAEPMLAVFRGIWWKENHFFLWDWMGLITILGCIVMIMMGIMINSLN